MEPITLDEAKQLKHGDILYEIRGKNADGTPKKWKVYYASSDEKTDDELYVPLRRGLYVKCHLTKNNLWAYTLTNK